jgi:hypothetical protein
MNIVQFAKEFYKIDRNAKLDGVSFDILLLWNRTLEYNN